jgi:exodeoxyribonuclease-1
MDTFYWYDYESWGTDTRRVHPCQFAGIRTDMELNEVGEPAMFFSRPSPDYLPHPMASVVTGITPQRALAEGLSEAEFCREVLTELSVPSTCSVGYNTISYDDELTRHMLYRCLYPPYEREFRNNNSRWDLLDLVRACFALRPEGIQWPVDSKGKHSFKLELLTLANNISHVGAHDALVDVRATIALARLIRQHQPKLFDYAFNLRKKQHVLNHLDFIKQDILVHISGRYNVEEGCLGLVIPIQLHPSNPNSIVVADVRVEPWWLSLPPVQVRELMFRNQEEWTQEQPRISLRTIQVNKCPFIAPLSTLDDNIVKRWQLDLSKAKDWREKILKSKHLSEIINTVYDSSSEELHQLPAEFGLYSGGFMSNLETNFMQKVHRNPPGQLASLAQDSPSERIEELLFLYRARNFPDTLFPKEAEQWQRVCRRRLLGEETCPGLNYPQFQAAMTELKKASLITPQLAQSLEHYAQELIVKAGIN